MNTERLLILANRLETVPSESFDLQSWRWTDTSDENMTLWSGSESPSSKGLSDEALLSSAETHCGTTGCAVGWACTIPEFQAAGLTFDPNWNMPMYTPIYGGKKQIRWGAPSAFFDLSVEECSYLFLDSNYAESENTDPRAVAYRIRKLVADPSTLPKSADMNLTYGQTTSQDA